MAAGGFKEFVAGETLDEDEINDFLMQGMLVFAGTAARGSAITAPVEGQFSFLTDSDTVEFYDGSAWVELASGFPLFEAVVVAGGGGGGRSNFSANASSGGGGAGGYRSNVAGEQDGNGVAANFQLFLEPGGTATVSVGGGGAGGGSTPSAGSRGANSRFGNIAADGGGGGPGLLIQGFRGGNSAGGSNAAAGGGGAAAQGTDVNNASGAGGAGVASSITGTSVTRAAGGAGNGNVAAGANTGNGAGGGDSVARAGGSGVVILKYPNTITLTIGAGLTSSTVTSGDFKITTFTAGEDTVTY